MERYSQSKRCLNHVAKIIAPIVQHDNERLLNALREHSKEHVGELVVEQEVSHDPQV